MVPLTSSRPAAETPLPPATVSAISALVDRATRADGSPPLSEAFLLGIESGPAPGVHHVLVTDGDEVVGYAQFRQDEGRSAELVVDPDARRRGAGSLLLAALPDDVRVWSHSDSAAARGFAAAHDLRAVRSLHVMARPLAPGSSGRPWPEAVVPPGYVVRTFVPGRDEDAWLRVNASAFAAHPEQGGITRADLDARMAQPWFDPEGFFLVARADRPDDVVAFHWTKVDPPGADTGEVYVVGVDPAHQGEGLGRAATVLGLDHLRSRGLREVELYVDDENAAAVGTYRSLGFEVVRTHRQYARSPRD